MENAAGVNPKNPADLIYLNFHPLVIMCRYRDLFNVFIYSPYTINVNMIKFQLIKQTVQNNRLNENRQYVYTTYKPRNHQLFYN